MIKLNQSSCVRYFSKFSQCNRCESICPVEAIECDVSRLNIDINSCIGCGGCVGVCPTEAFELSSIDMIEFAFEFLKEEKNYISCKDNFVCLAGLNVEYLICFGLVKDVELDIGFCNECDIASKCFSQIEQNVAEANYVLENIGGNEIRAKKLYKRKDEGNRREFFNIFTLKGALKVKEEFEEAIKNLDVSLDKEQIELMKQRDIPNKRKLLFTILKKIKKPKEYKYLENRYLSFISNKEIDSSCDNCSMCYRICPTTALSSDRKNSKIEFDALLCVRCHLCHDVCEKDSIKLCEFFDTKEFFEPTQKELIRFDVKICQECGANFSYFGGEVLCNRCKAEDEAAKELWGIR